MDSLDRRMMMSDTISRQAAIERVLSGKLSDDSLVECVEECNSMLEWAADVLKNLPSAEPETCVYWDRESNFCALHRPSAEPERLTDEDFETIRIHLNAYKEQLCNQHRWEEAEEYQRIIDRFMAFASAQPDYTELKREFLRMASYIDVLLKCSDEQKETLVGFISRLSEYMPWTERD